MLVGELVVSIHLNSSNWMISAQIGVKNSELISPPMSNVSWFHHLYAATQHNFTVHCSGDKHLLDSAESGVVSTNRDPW